MSADPNLQSSDEIAPRAPESAAGDGVSTSVQPVRKSVFREYAEAIAVAMVLAFAIRVFVVQAFKIPSGSMIPTLLIGDHILVSKLAYGIQWPSDCKFQVSFPPVNCYASHALIEFGKPQRGEIRNRIVDEHREGTERPRCSHVADQHQSTNRCPHDDHGWIGDRLRAANQGQLRRQIASPAHRQHDA